MSRQLFLQNEEKTFLIDDYGNRAKISKPNVTCCLETQEAPNEKRCGMLKAMFISGISIRALYF